MLLHTHKHGVQDGLLGGGRASPPNKMEYFPTHLWRSVVTPRMNTANWSVFPLRVGASVKSKGEGESDWQNLFIYESIVWLGYHVGLQC